MSINAIFNNQEFKIKSYDNIFYRNHFNFKNLNVFKKLNESYLN